MKSGLVEIDESSKIPKYQQVADYIISEIGGGFVKVGDKIPSINETSEELLLSRDTVEKAYKNLRKRGIITAVQGKGFYVTSTIRSDGKRILLAFNKLSDHKKAIYNSFIKKLGDTATVDLHVHNSDNKILEKIIIENLGKYDFYVIMPHLKDETDSVKDAINKISKDKLLLINKDLDGISGEYGCVYEDFEQDIYQALLTGIARIKRYKKLILIFPTENYYCTGIRDGFINFCRKNEFDFDIIGSAQRHEIKSKELYIVIEEADLVEIVKKATSKNLSLGRNIGIIAYNDSPFKEILAGGISVLSTDFERMGAEIADMIQTRTQRKRKNPFSLILRSSV
ncbi:MAG: GntR family transcriptional regulator [Cyclobacteriaceae bacterium]|nr:MAG: GntR family transcriptional regulator [Cyclobacteriaceae bacterium]